MRTPCATSRCKESAPAPPGRRGFTLLELLLVLAILVALAALATPSISRWLDGQRLRGAGDQIRAELARARVAAMKSGRVHIFRYDVGQGTYQTAYWEAADDALEANQAAAEFDSANGVGVARAALGSDEQQLPEGVRFFGGQTLQDARGTVIEAELAAGQGLQAQPVLFYADGSTSTADITLINQRNRLITVSLRGLTGIATSCQPFRLEDGPVGSGRLQGAQP